MPNKQDRKTQRLFNNVTKSILTQNNGLKRDPETGILYEEPLKEEHPIGSLLLLRGAGPAAAKGLGWIGEKMMPSALLKGIGQTFTKLAKATTAISPYADAGLLATWGAQGIREAKEAVKEGDTAGAIAGASMAALPLMGINPEAARELTTAQKANKVARALNKEVKGTEIVDSPVTQNIFAGKLGWAPKQSKVIWHNSETPISKLESTFPAWDIVKRDAPLGHVWGTGTETTQGFIGSRPFHLRSTKPVEMNKPMVQLNESIGNGKNAVRNEILKFADQSGADAVNFSNIKDNTLSNQDVYAVFKDVEVKPKLSEAERLGIPKGERSNPKALEDPQYWGYQQWNKAYNDAIASGDTNAIQAIRDAHFKIKAPNTKVINKDGSPLILFHGTREPFNIFDLSRSFKGKTGFFFAKDKKYALGFAKNEYPTIKNVYLNAKNAEYVPEIDSWEIYSRRYPEDYNEIQRSLGFPERKPSSADLFYGKDSGTTQDVMIVTSPQQIKLVDPITYDDKDLIIPIVKRDNFHNPDIRYKQGGILKQIKYD